MKKEAAYNSPLFLQLAGENGLTEERIEELRSHAADVEKYDLPVIYDQTHFSQMVGYEYDYLLAMSN